MFPLSFSSENDPADSWDVEDDPVITPDEDDLEDLDDVEGDATPKVSKKKIPKVEESRSKKEHVNVVFIGHVGKSRVITVFTNFLNTKILMFVFFL